MTLIGMIHLAALPGGPRPSAGFADVRSRAVADAHALAEGGADGLILENFGDAPFPAGPVEPHVVAFLAILAAQIRERYPHLKIGLNLLRNDAHGAMGAAAAAGADFIRVNVHVGAMLTDQGILQGQAHQTLRYRQELGCRVQVAADVMVKHAVPLGPQEIGAVAADTFRRGGAEVLIVTGQGTGHGTDPSRVEAVRAAVPEATVWVGSGVTLETALAWRGRAHGAIVGTALHRRGRIEEPVEMERVRALRQLWS